MTTAKASRATTRRVVLTRDAFRSLAVLVGKAMTDCAAFEPQTSYPRELRSKYDLLYARCAELFSDVTLSKSDKENLAYLSNAVKIQEFDFVLGTMVLSFERTEASVTKRYVLYISNEFENNIVAAKKVNVPEDAVKIDRGYALL